MTNKRAAVIYYPGRIDRRRLMGLIHANLLPAGWEPTLWFRTTPQEHGGVQAQRAIAQNITHILVAGGDGTVREVLEAVANSGSAEKVTVGILPSGTGNVLARNLRLELNDLATAVRRGLLGNRHPMDMGLARIIGADGVRTEMLFAVMAGVGLDAKIMQRTDTAKKRKYGWVAYIEGGFKSLPLQYAKLRIRCDANEPKTLRVLTLLVGNAGWLPGNLGLMPDASLDDGRLDVAAIAPRRAWEWVDFWSRVGFANKYVRPNRVGRQLLDATANVKTLENMRGAKIRVTPESPIYMQLDGDPFGEISEVEFEVVPRAVVIRS
ncbi:MAG: hypothetical protein RI933_962 [Actinomycetota bacterium]|jgi:diacylglycerol kinase family enzyme